MMLDVFCGAQEPLKNKAAEQVRAILDRGGHCLILVPETATLKTERFFLKRLGLQGSFDLEVLSPSHLEENVFAALGRGEGESVTLDERGKAVAVAAALKGCKEELVYYGRVADLQGFVQQISDTLRDLKRAGVTPETLSGFAQGLPQGASRDRVADHIRTVHPQWPEM